MSIELVQYSQPKTHQKISAEGYHNALQSLFSASHPTIWKFIRGIEKDISRHRLTVQQARVANPEKKRAKYQILAARLADKIGEYESTQNKVEYLRDVALIAYGNNNK